MILRLRCAGVINRDLEAHRLGPVDHKVILTRDREGLRSRAIVRAQHQPCWRNRALVEIERGEVQHHQLVRCGVVRTAGEAHGDRRVVTCFRRGIVCDRNKNARRVVVQILSRVVNRRKRAVFRIGRRLHRNGKLDGLSAVEQFVIFPRHHHRLCGRPSGVVKGQRCRRACHFRGIVVRDRQSDVVQRLGVELDGEGRIVSILPGSVVGSGHGQSGGVVIREGGGDVVRDKGTVFGICRVDWREPDFGGGVGGMVNEIVDAPDGDGL